jgi:hypothetical protein
VPKRKPTIIDESTPADVLFPAGCNTGLVARDLRDDPVEMFEPPSDIQVIPRSEWDARIKEQDEQKSSLKHIWMRADAGKLPKNLYQNGFGYCWAHSTVNAAMLARAVANQPFKYLSAFAVAAIIKGGRNQGGWCGQSAKFVQEVGIPTQELWPQGKTNLSLDTPQMRQNAALHKIVEEWRDLSRPIHGQVMTFDQVATCLLLNQPCALDFMWWTHSVCGVRLVRIESGSYGIEILNSWGDTWGTQGFGILQGSRTIPDGAIGIRSIRAAA